MVLAGETDPVFFPNTDFLGTKREHRLVAGLKRTRDVPGLDIQQEKAGGEKGSSGGWGLNLFCEEFLLSLSRTGLSAKVSLGVV